MAPANSPMTRAILLVMLAIPVVIFATPHTSAPSSRHDVERQKLYSAAYRDIICQKGYSSAYRLHGQSYKDFRDRAFAQAEEPTWKQCHGENDPRDYCLIVDHIRALEIWPPDGGDPNAMPNVQLQTKAASLEKDKLENRARWDYCDGRATLEEVNARFVRTSK